MYQIHVKIFDEIIDGQTFSSAVGCICEVIKAQEVYQRNNMPMTSGYHAHGGNVWYVTGSNSGMTAEALVGFDWKTMVVHRSKRSWRWSVYVEALTKEDAMAIAYILAHHNVHYISDHPVDCHTRTITQDVSLATAQAYCLFSYVSLVESPHNATRISESLHNYVPKSNLRLTLSPGDSVLVYRGNKWQLVTVLEEPV